MFAAGQSIGNYRVLSKLGTGGMGMVYLAEHPLIGKRVALKVIHRELATNREVVQRFFQEARAVNQIGNEHIVEIHDFGVTGDGDHFFIMEYLEGVTLAAQLAAHRALPMARALHVGAQIASALGAAHQSGVIHRDLKPDNVMLIERRGDPDFVKVLDFGLAKVFTGESAVKTAAGVLLGTPQYMSPEACESRREVDHRTDVYALGVVLFQMTTGALPFEGPSMGAVLVKQVTELPPPPRALNPEIPPSVEQIILRCLAKPPEARFASMAVLREALLDPERYLHGSPPVARARSVAPGELRRAALELPGASAPAPADAATVLGRAPPTLPAPVAPLVNQTMRIATPHGYSSRPPRRSWPIVLVLGLLLGLGGGAFALAWFGDAGSPAGPGDPPPPDPPAGRAAGIAADAAVAVAVDAAAPVGARPPADAGAFAQLTIESTPPGASVFGPDGAFLGKTPLVQRWPLDPRPVVIELRLAGYRRRIKEVVVGGDTAIGLELERLTRIRACAAPGRRSATTS